MNNATNLLQYVPVLDGSTITWVGKRGCIEASSLPAPAMQQARTVDYDPGFIVRSHRTGVKKFFFFTWQLHDNEGEVTGWQYETADGLTLVVFND